jgi:hypothetical protein
MLSTETERKPVFADAVSDLTEADVVLEITARSAASGIDQAGIDSLQNALEASYGALAKPLGARFERVALLEEAPRRCSTVWLRVQSREDAGNALASSLKYLAEGTLAIIAWMDGTSNQRIADLQQVIRLLAWGASAMSATSPAAPSAVDLVNAVSAWQRAKSAVRDAESVRIITQDGSTELDLSKAIANPRGLLLERKLTSATAMILVVEVPDYSGRGAWQFKHGEGIITVHCEPGTLLDRFYTRELDIRPGDALHCQVETETLYGPDHEMLGQSLKLVQVIEVLRAGSSAERERRFDKAEPTSGSVRELRPSSRTA